MRLKLLFDGKGVDVRKDKCVREKKLRKWGGYAYIGLCIYLHAACFESNQKYPAVIAEGAPSSIYFDWVAALCDVPFISGWPRAQLAGGLVQS